MSAFRNALKYRSFQDDCWEVSLAWDAGMIAAVAMTILGGTRYPETMEVFVAAQGVLFSFPVVVSIQFLRGRRLLPKLVEWAAIALALTLAFPWFFHVALSRWVLCLLGLSALLISLVSVYIFVARELPEEGWKSNDIPPWTAGLATVLCLAYGFVCSVAPVVPIL
jgi:hypothetical protein